MITMSAPKILGDFCPICKRYRHTDRHICPPTWLAQFEGGTPGEWSVVYAVNESDAACELVQQWDKALARFTTHAIVLVKRNDGREVLWRFVVTGAQHPAYVATRADEDQTMEFGAE